MFDILTAEYEKLRMLLLKYGGKEFLSAYFSIGKAVLFFECAFGVE